MTAIIRPITALLLSAAILLMGNGLAGVLLPIRADLEGFSRLELGLMGSFHYAGLMAGCLLIPGILGRVGHIRGITACSALVTMTPLLHAMWPDPVVWCLLRALTGLCFAGLFMIIESWLTGVSTPETRGRVLGLYTIINLTVVTAGIQLIGVSDAKDYRLFSLIAILYSVAAVPLALQSSPAPEPPRRPKLRLLWLMSVSPAAVVGCFGAGLANGAFWSLAPIYATGNGLSVRDAALFMTLVVIGGAVGQWPVGYLSDKFERRTVLAAVAALASLAGLLLLAASGLGFHLIMAAGIVYGLMAFPIYSVCVAHANDLVHRKRAVEVSTGLLLTFSVAAVAGPFLAALIMSTFGHGGLFLHSSLAHGTIAAFMVIRFTLWPRVVEKLPGGFVALPKTTPAVFDLDPRGEKSGPPSNPPPLGKAAA
ncbi:MAG: MFS transporter [Hyphomicrobiaceae bacterium]|nr:MAG: MFS transporter [Hyphomicrobiaceae bacterium]